MRRGELFSLCVLAKFESNTSGFYIDAIIKMKEGVCYKDRVKTKMIQMPSGSD